MPLGMRVRGRGWDAPWRWAGQAIQGLPAWAPAPGFLPERLHRFTGRDQSSRVRSGLRGVGLCSSWPRSQASKGGGALPRVHGSSKTPRSVVPPLVSLTRAQRTAAGGGSLPSASPQSLGEDPPSQSLWSSSEQAHGCELCKGERGGQQLTPHPPGPWLCPGPGNTRELIRLRTFLL